MPRVRARSKLGAHEASMLLRTLMVFFAGGAGSAARYLAGLRIQQAMGGAFPLGTVTINITGSFLIAMIMGISLRTTWLTADTRLLLTTGFCGGYTTYSTFNYETLALAQQGAWGLAAAYVSSTLVGCLVAGVLGLFLARLVAG
ncbi:MAG: fluoride efflux transporter CrcB [Deltaproteobacteria bacterium]|nr:fluoride efflux transporter CrcB [Deltaproteobacteria bacterium]